MKKEACYKALKDAYFNDTYQNSSNTFFREWIAHKYKHSLEVVKVGLELIKREKVLRDLPTTIQRDFEIALLFHDLARAVEVSPKTGKFLRIHHAIEGARQAVALGETSPNVILPVLIHSSINEDLLNIQDEKTLQKLPDFKCLSLKDKNFLLEWRKIFHALTEDQRNIVRLGIALVKDADKLANLENLPWIIYANNRKVSPVISKRVLYSLLSGELVNSKHVKTLADDLQQCMALVNDLRFSSSIKWIKEKKILENICRTLFEFFFDIDPLRKEKLKRIANRAVRKVEEIMEHRLNNYYRSQP